MQSAVQRLKQQEEELKQQRHSLQLSLDANQMTINSLNADIDGLTDEKEKELKRRRLELENKHKAAVKNIKIELQNLNDEAEKVHQEKLSRQKRCLSLQDQLITEKNNSNTLTYYKAIDENGLSMQIRMLTEYNTNTTLEVEDLQKQIESFSELEKLLENEVKEMQENIEEKKIKTEELQDTVDCLCGEIQELRVKLDNTNEEEVIHNPKGNSLFVEVEERRLLLQTKLPQLQKLCEHLQNYSDRHKKKLHEVSLAFQNVKWDNKDAGIIDCRRQFQESMANLTYHLQKLKELDEYIKSKLNEITFHFIIRPGIHDQNYLQRELEKKREKVRAVRKALETESYLVQASNYNFIQSSLLLKKRQRSIDIEKRNKKVLEKKLLQLQTITNEEVAKTDDLEQTYNENISEKDISELKSFSNDTSIKMKADHYPTKKQGGLNPKPSNKCYYMKDRKQDCKQM